MFKVHDHIDKIQTVNKPILRMVCDCIDFKTCTVIQVTHNHDNHCCDMKR